MNGPEVVRNRSCGSWATSLDCAMLWILPSATSAIGLFAKSPYIRNYDLRHPGTHNCRVATGGV